MKFTPAGGTVHVRISSKSVRNVPTAIKVSNCCECEIVSITLTSLQATNDVVGYLRVDVTDSGVGIAKDDQSKVFGQFEQFNKNELQGGGENFHLYRLCFFLCFFFMNDLVFQRRLWLRIVDITSYNHFPSGTTSTSTYFTSSSELFLL